jgi:hypothetical protein
MAEGVIQDCRNRDLPDVDSMVVAGSVVETQLYDLVAEDMAIEDTIYVLGKALDRERIGLDVFLKVCALACGKPYPSPGKTLTKGIACEDAGKRAVFEESADKEDFGGAGD